MTKETAIKGVLKYAPISSDFQKVLSMDETIKTGVIMNMNEVRNECFPGETGPEAA